MSIYWTDPYGAGIGKASLDGKQVDRTFIPLPPMEMPRGVASDQMKVYWTDPRNYSIGRANSDGSSVERAFISDCPDPNGIAVRGEYIYWANQSANTIGRATRDGKSVDQKFITGARGPWDVAVDGYSIYWTNTDDKEDARSIGKANLDGTKVNEFLIWETLNVVASDGRYLYFDSQPKRAGGGVPELGWGIGRAKVDGTDVDWQFIQSTEALGLAIDPTHLYWCNMNSILRANLDGGDVASVVTDINAEKIAVDALP
jgi:virginiamycin B lyase